MPTHLGTQAEAEEMGFRSESSRSLQPVLSQMPVVVDAGELPPPVSAVRVARVV